MESSSIQTGIIMGKVSKKADSKQQAIINGDFFAAFLASITQGDEDGATDILAQLSMGETDSNEQAMEMMADLLNGTMGFDWLMSNQSSKSPVDSEVVKNAQMMQNLMLSQSGKAVNFSAEELTAILSHVEQTPTPQTKQFNMLGLQQQIQGYGDAEQAQEAELVLGSVSAKDTTGSSDSLFKGTMGFQSAIMQAQKLIKGQSEETTEDLSPDALQQGLGQTKFDAILNEKPVQTVGQQALDVDDLAQQVKNGLESSILGNNKEFSVKLKPEGLGEITIKLIESQNKLSVSIVAATSEVAKLLNNDLSTLRDTMRAMQIELNDVEVQQQTDFGDMQQNLQQQMFKDGNRQYGDSRNRNDFNEQALEDIEVDLLASEPVYVENERMNRYV